MVFVPMWHLVFKKFAIDNLEYVNSCRFQNPKNPLGSANVKKLIQTATKIHTFQLRISRKLFSRFVSIAKFLANIGLKIQVFDKCASCLKKSQLSMPGKWTLAAFTLCRKHLNLQVLKHQKFICKTLLTLAVNNVPSCYANWKNSNYMRILKSALSFRNTFRKPAELQLSLRGRALNDALLYKTL